MLENKLMKPNHQEYENMPPISSSTFNDWLEDEVLPIIGDRILVYHY